MSSYGLEGLESLGSMFCIVVQNNAYVDLPNSSIQRFCIQAKGSEKYTISGGSGTICILQNTLVYTYSLIWMLVATKLLGATKPLHAPEPHDVVWYLQAEINLGGEI